MVQTLQLWYLHSTFNQGSTISQFNHTGFLIYFVLCVAFSFFQRRSFPLLWKDPLKGHRISHWALMEWSAHHVLPSSTISSMLSQRWMSCCQRRGATTLYVGSGLNVELTMNCSLEGGRSWRGQTCDCFCPKACCFPSGPAGSVQKQDPQCWCWIHCLWEWKRQLQRWASLPRRTKCHSSRNHFFFTPPNTVPQESP